MLPAQFSTLKAQLLAKQTALAWLCCGAQLQILFQRPPQAPQAACLEPCTDTECGLCHSSGVQEWEGGIHSVAGE